jgi:hypothetical protein
MNGTLAAAQVDFLDSPIATRDLYKISFKATCPSRANFTTTRADRTDFLNKLNF